MKRAMWLIPLLLLGAGTLLFRYSDLDYTLTHTGFAGTHAFASTDGGFWGLLYKTAAWPAIALGIWSVIQLLAAWRWKWLRRYNKMAWCLLAAGILGPGLIVNLTLKDHFGRPRPRQVEAFGGDYAFLPVLSPGPHEDGRSFPSGHASIAFFLLTPFFLCGRNRRLAAAFLLAGLGWGTLVGVGRVLQGGHWPSDVLWAAGIVYLTGYVLSGAFGFRRPSRRVTR